MISSGVRGQNVKTGVENFKNDERITALQNVSADKISTAKT